MFFFVWRKLVDNAFEENWLDFATICYFPQNWRRHHRPIHSLLPPLPVWNPSCNLLYPPFSSKRWQVSDLNITIKSSFTTPVGKTVSYSFCNKIQARLEKCPTHCTHLHLHHVTLQRPPNLPFLSQDTHPTLISSIRDLIIFVLAQRWQLTYSASTHFVLDSNPSPHFGNFSSFYPVPQLFNNHIKFLKWIELDMPPTNTEITKGGEVPDMKFISLPSTSFPQQHGDNPLRFTSKKIGSNLFLPFSKSPLIFHRRLPSPQNHSKMVYTSSRHLIPTLT